MLGTVDVITQRRDAVLQRWSDFKAVAAERRAQLEDSRKLQQFLRNVEELEAWMGGKMQIAADESWYKETTNLQVRRFAPPPPSTSPPLLLT